MNDRIISVAKNANGSWDADIMLSPQIGVSARFSVHVPPGSPSIGQALAAIIASAEAQKLAYIKALRQSEAISNIKFRVRE